MTEKTSLDYVKAIVSSLDYSLDQRQSRARLVLQRALTSTNEMARKWCTRFLAVLASLPNLSFNNWGTKFLITQLGDPSAKVVRHAIRIILHHAPQFGQSLRLLRTAQLDSFGEAGILMKAALISEEEHCTKNPNEITAAIRFWIQSFNIRYGEIVEEEMRIAMLGVRRTVSGHFARPSHERFERYGVRAHPHLLGELTKHQTGKQLLQSEAVVDYLLEQIGDEHVAIVKGALLALGQIGRQDPNFLPNGCVAQIIRLAEQADVLSLRGTAFYALCLIGATRIGAKMVARFGWESSRYRTVINELRTELRAVSTPTHRPTTNFDGLGTLPIDRRSSLFTDSPCPSPSPQRLRSRSLASVGEVRNEKKRKSAPSIFVESPQESRSLSPLGYMSPRGDRSLTIDSFYASATTEDDRKRAFSILARSLVDENEDTPSRSSTMNTGLLSNPKSPLEVELENLMMASSSQNEHFSTKNRLRWKLQAPRIRQFIQVFESVGHPVRYNLMTREQLFELGEYSLQALDDPTLHKELELCAELPSPAHYPLPYISLPTEIELICRNIFNMPRSDIACDGGFTSFEDRGAKSGHGRLRLDQMKAHDRHRCFFCTIPESRRPQITIGNDSAQLRLDVLQLIDLLEIKRIIPEKKLLSLRRKHSWLFEWPCLYADVLEMLDQYRFKVRSRAFLQEIFYQALKL
ncbi:unnamed protein product, partial [Mesorhabditis belari]|uniref:Rapamycin-insensitive companion of mTOR domain-containing protein n=1 Tax=Mesorhabditis belari TaxID=2138241 RepID=A0AAF3J5N7_9BILA